ncbi:MAG: sugar ABC transporter permease [Chitinophagaceae bacterium]|nr:sugar ABC transporter permease [Anaerolineae bacterium]
MQQNMEADQIASLPPAKNSVRYNTNRWLDNNAKTVLIAPTILIVLFLSVFPLLVSLYLSFSRFKFVRGGFEISWIGFKNYEKLLFGSEQRRFLGRFGEVTLVGWLLLAICVLFLVYSYLRYIRGPNVNLSGLFFRLVTVIFTCALVALAISTLSGRGLPGTLVVTLSFVFISVTLQYVIGLGLALLATQNLPGKRFFRVTFLLPMMITPVGIGFLFRMMTDTGKGPFKPIWVAIGLGDFSWIESAWSARIAVIIGDIWQWTPFTFIILLAALEGIQREMVEAALVDGTNRRQLFRFIMLPQIIPVSLTVVLIRIIETFKIIDIPSTLTYGGPGTATESATLYAYSLWRALDLGMSAAIAYLLLIVVTFVALVYVNIIRQRLLERI